MSTPDLLSLSPVVPVVLIDDVATAVPLARALVAGGVGIIEVTLRTPAALDSMRAIAAEVPEIVLGAGTVLTPEQAEACAEAGAGFLVSPGATPGLLEAMLGTGLSVLPGVATVSEAIACLERGVTELKFFPASASGGAAFLGALASPLPQVRFCPTGGISLATAPDYLSLSNVGCVGGSWLTPAAAIEAGDWGLITELAAAAAALPR